MAKKPQKTKKTPPTVSDQPLLEKKARSDSPTGEGNTIGEIVGQPPQVTKAPGEASPILKSGTQTEKSLSAQAYDSAKKLAVEGGKSAAEMGKGAAKDTWNFGVDIAELAYPAAQREAARDMEDAARWYELFGNKEHAKVLSEAAEEARERADTGNLDELRVTLDNPEQELGATLGDLNPKGIVKGMVKGIAKGGSKVMSMFSGKGEARKNSRAKRRQERAEKRDEKTPQKNPEELKKELKENQQNKGGKVKGVKKAKPSCFNPYNGKHYKSLKTDKERKAYVQEYEAQLRRQQDAINEMTPAEFKSARKAFKKTKETNTKGIGRHQDAGKAQEKFREEFEEVLSDRIFKNEIDKKTSLAKAEEIAETKSKEIMDKLAALHEPDMSAGGQHHPKPKRMGSTNVNSAIGKSWSYRIATLDKAAQEAIDSGLADAKMNVQLEVCRKNEKKSSRRKKRK
ncbi:hypothetical protein Xmau_04462 [Xenorhabdus mauleonii]|uniref:Novel toxin 15 n=1 Tax=Xenorhabdus mauleonii TaxID=351675 RepID=A0A1I3Y7H6_9GAMM|nr:polymorphic toxin type 15 domain-containing protein [Xenorhabdus mauleonii]PHM35781.1 hypothetical protein Xmau_04462 [Xenorhabdus mauleonii]SFK27221.1 Novel toxin 15 [Xenorhabdus mauleonii]